MRFAAIRPPQLQRVGHEIARVARCAEHDVELIGGQFQNAGRCEHRLGVHVVIDGLNHLRAACHAAARKFADLYFGFRIERNAERFRIAGRLCVDVSQVVKDSVGLGNLF
jgi:hypothetical protein